MLCTRGILDYETHSIMTGTRTTGTQEVQSAKMHNSPALLEVADADPVQQKALSIWCILGEPMQLAFAEPGTNIMNSISSALCCTSKGPGCCSANMPVNKHQPPVAASGPQAAYTAACAAGFWHHHNPALTKTGRILQQDDLVYLSSISAAAEALALGEVGMPASLQLATNPINAMSTAAPAKTTTTATATTTTAVVRSLLADEGESVELPPVDVVFAWVNGTDPTFMKRFKQTTGENPMCDRVQNNNEILMSLLAIRKHQPWVNHIHIVVDQQTFDLEFLDPEWRAKVSFVDLRDFVPSQYLPTFNSHTFETFLYRIPGLSEHFAYLNDDMVISKPLNLERMFERTSKGLKLRVMLRSRPPGDPYTLSTSWNWPRINGRMLFRSAFKGKDPPGYDAHSAYFLTREAMQKTWEMFGKQLEGPLQHNKRRKYSSLKDGGDVHATSLAQQVGVELGILATGNPVRIEFVQHDASHTLAKYVKSMFYGHADIVCLQSLLYMSDARLRLLCNLVSDLWCMSGTGDQEQQQRCKQMADMCSRRDACEDEAT